MHPTGGDPLLSLFVTLALLPGVTRPRLLAHEFVEIVEGDPAGAIDRPVGSDPPEPAMRVGEQRCYLAGKEPIRPRRHTDIGFLVVIASRADGEAE